MLNISCYFNFQKIMSLSFFTNIRWPAGFKDAGSRQQSFLGQQCTFRIRFLGFLKIAFLHLSSTLGCLFSAAFKTSAGFISFIVLFLYSFCFSTFCSCYLPYLSYCYNFLWPTFFYICARKSHNFQTFVLPVSGSEKKLISSFGSSLCKFCLELFTKKINSLKILNNSLINPFFLDMALMVHWDCRACYLKPE